MVGKPTLTLLVGGQNAGKSTYLTTQFTPVRQEGAVRYVEKDGHPFTIISRDAIREAYAAQETIAYQETFDKKRGGKHDNQVDRRFIKAIGEALLKRESIIIDNTNMTAADRTRLLYFVNENYHRAALIFPCTAEEALSRNAARDAAWAAEGKPERNIPEFIIRATYDSYQEPNKAEGFDSIREAATVKKVRSETSAHRLIGA